MLAALSFVPGVLIGIVAAYAFAHGGASTIGSFMVGATAAFYFAGGMIVSGLVMLALAQVADAIVATSFYSKRSYDLLAASNEASNRAKDRRSPRPDS